MQVLRYKGKPFGSVQSLARALEVSEHDLRYVAANAERYYHPNTPEPKGDGTYRQHYRVDPKLKRIQKAINKNIFGKTIFPDYLTGGIRDKDHPRDYVTDATVHSGRRNLIAEDIKNFFPSVCADLVRRMWQGLYHLRPEVADVLTKLTTYQGFLPQGAPTSTYIGNLVLWDEEPQVVARLDSIGIRYTRYIDNISLSHDEVHTREAIREVTSLVYGMLYRHGLRPKRRKRVTSTRRKAQILHGLNLNSGHPTLPKKKRALIGNAIQEVEDTYDHMTPGERKKSTNSLTGKAEMVRRFHPLQGAKLTRRVNSLVQRDDATAGT